MLADDDLVLDVGGWGKPFPRADFVLDLMPYETRGMYGNYVRESERFSAETWITRDICAREPWPFPDGKFDFVICSHTLEDVRDPVWVCSELMRIARAGYIEVPSRLEEQTWGLADPCVGWSHHHWLIDVRDGAVQFVFKPHVLNGRPDFYFPGAVNGVLTRDERVQALFWDGEFDARERIFFELEEFERYLGGFVDEHRDALVARIPRRPLRRRIAGRVRGLAGRAQALWA